MNSSSPCYRSVEHRSVSLVVSESRKPLQDMQLFNSPLAQICESRSLKCVVKISPLQDALLFLWRFVFFWPLFGLLCMDCVASMHSTLIKEGCVEWPGGSLWNVWAIECNWRITLTSSGLWTQIVGITNCFSSGDGLPVLWAKMCSLKKWKIWLDGRMQCRQKGRWLPYAGCSLSI